MKQLVIGFLVLAALVLSQAVPALAQQFPEVANLKGFSVETNFMSLPGYLRWLVYTQGGQWISYAEAARVVGEQVAAP